MDPRDIAVEAVYTSKPHTSDQFYALATAYLELEKERDAWKRACEIALEPDKLRRSLFAFEFAKAKAAHFDYARAELAKETK